MGTANLMKFIVGGQAFEAPEDALKTSLYFRKLASNVPQPDAIIVGEELSGYYWIDRDPEIFRDILHYLKTLEIHSTDEHYLRILQNEARFYGFDDLVKRIDLMLTDTALYDKLFKETYESKETGYLPVNFDTVKFDTTLNQTLVQAFRYPASQDHYEAKIVIKNS
ncbi:uncharacterized protein ATC70_006118 [Mucor velutinosus]|uniref:BTB domain-containing protein n=1 Tax=Mucor velutinosus TaxID=708070 RepID=A0AAN7DGM4_9FUNG|nr:hypothetical protein ATC70_006118 [Mucor velutinosus]